MVWCIGENARVYIAHALSNALAALMTDDLYQKRITTYPVSTFHSVMSVDSMNARNQSSI